MIVRALLSLRPGAHWTMDGEEYGGINWHDTERTKPTEAEVVAEVQRLMEEDVRLQYKQQRASEYPSLADQLDMLYHDRLNNTDNWLQAIQAVKDKYPKP